jgi:hypothetical protein
LIQTHNRLLRAVVHAEAREQAKRRWNFQCDPRSAGDFSSYSPWALYSDDAAQVPIQMRARLSWGTLTFYLLWSKKVSIDQLERLQFVEQYDVQPLFLT